LKRNRTWQVRKKKNEKIKDGSKGGKKVAHGICAVKIKKIVDE
jgi:hypothetical protein